MSEELPTPPSNDPQPPTPAPKDTPDMAAEMRAMGQQFEAMFRAAIESERAKQLRSDLAGGVQELSNQIQAALKTVQSSPLTQQAEERGRQLLEQAQQSKFVQELQETVVNGVAQLNERLRQLVAQLEQQSATPPAASTTQQVPVESEPPTDEPLPTPPVTGETRRLDDEL